MALASSLLASDVEAGGGFGSVQFVSATHNSITVGWSNSSDKYRYCTSPPLYYLCRKKAGSLVDTCSNFKTPVTTSNPYTLTGLDSSERYKIKGYAKAEKKIFGKFRKCTDRKVFTLKQETRPAPAPLSFALSPAGTTSSSISARVEYSQPHDLTSIRACYKRKWRLLSLNAKCQEDIPFTNPPRNARRGYGQVSPGVSDVIFTFDGLSKCRTYKVVAYGFYADDSFIKIGTAEWKTAGKCFIFGKRSLFLLSSIVDDYDEVALDYLNAVDEFYGSLKPPGLISHLISTHPFLYEEIIALGEDILDLSNEAGLFEYLLEEHPDDVLALWQEESDLTEHRLDIATWLADNQPDLLAELLAEHALLYASSASGDLMSIDHISGHGSLEGVLAPACDGGTVEGIEYDEVTGRAFAVGGAGSACIWEFNVVDGSAIGNPVATPVPFSSLEVVDGIWYAISNVNDANGGLSQLWTWDDSTGATSMIGTTGIGPLAGIAWDETHGVMFGITDNGGASELVVVNLGTGLATPIGVTGVTAGGLQSGPDDRLYVSGSGADAGALFLIDPLTGAAAFVGPTGFGDVTGLTLVVDSNAAPDLASSVFADGFESGDFSNWGAEQP